MGCDFSCMSCLLAENNTFMREVLHILMNLQGVRNEPALFSCFGGCWPVDRQRTALEPRNCQEEIFEWLREGGLRGWILSVKSHQIACEGAGGKRPQIVDSLTNADRTHRQLEVLSECNQHTAFGGPIKLG